MTMNTEIQKCVLDVQRRYAMEGVRKLERELANLTKVLNLKKRKMARRNMTPVSKRANDLLRRRQRYRARRIRALLENASALHPFAFKQLTVQGRKRILKSFL